MSADPAAANGGDGGVLEHRTDSYLDAHPGAREEAGIVLNVLPIADAPDTDVAVADDTVDAVDNNEAEETLGQRSTSFRAAVGAEADDAGLPLISATTRSQRRHSATLETSFSKDAAAEEGADLGDTVYVRERVLVHKVLIKERRAQKDLNALANGSWQVPAVLGMTETEPLDITARLLSQLAEASGGDAADEDLIKAFVSQERVLRNRDGSAAGRIQTWGTTIQGPGYRIALASSPSVTRRCRVAIGRVERAIDLGGSDPIVNFVILVVGPENIAETKSELEVGRTLSALFSEPAFFGAALGASTATELKAAVQQYVARHTVGKDGLLPKRASSTFDAGFDSDEENGDEKSTLARPTGRGCSGLVRDFRRRARCYAADFYDMLYDPRSRLKLASATMFVFCSNVANAIAFGAVNSDNTTPPGETIGYFSVREMLISQALGGILWAFVSGQPLVVVQTTGPLAVFFKVLFSWSETLGVDFLPFYAVVGIWLSVMLAAIAFTGASRIMEYVTLFTMEIFALLVAGIFLSEAITWIYKDYNDTSDDPNRSVFLLNFILWSLVYLVGTRLVAARRSLLFNRTIRTILSDFGPIMAICIASAVAYMPKGISDIPINKLTLPDTPPWEPSIPRSWLVDIGELDAGNGFIAVFPALLLCILFFLDHNTTGLLVNRPENRLTKGAAYHLDFLSLAVVNLVLSILGLPWVHGALPFSPMHAQALADADEYMKNGVLAREVKVARETRLSNLLAHILILFLVGARPLLESIPIAVLYGFFLFVGVSALDDNSLWKRVELFVTEPVNYPPNHFIRLVPVRTLHCFTLMQLALFAVLWMVKAEFYVKTAVPISLFFPFILALIPPFRIKVLPKLFAQKDIDAILAGEEAEVRVFV